jgi:hypothetical protein
MAGIIGELIVDFLGNIVLNSIFKLFMAISSLILEAPLKLMGVRESWGFSYKKHRFIAILNLINLILIPIYIYNFDLSSGLFICLGIFLTIVIVLYFMNTNATPTKESSDLPGDDFSK